MIVHVVQWLAMGATLGPVEPSESMETLKHGVVTVGFIFFAVAIVSTAILGRWFCGWGCHVVMLQDFCASLLHKLGARPKPFRSRLLRFLPLALAIYMFVWPVVYRIAVAPFVQTDLVPISLSSLSWNLTTTQYWATFPSVWIAIPFLIVCGFIAVWFLGQKGYCTYACPYGGVFAPVDELAVGRIRVTDACEGCGHCTAVCTSNVRVHEEVARYGMVVDPGCMKCTDCVSVCPKDALYFGFGAPAIGTPKPAAPTKHWDLSLRGEYALLAVALFAFYAVYFPFGASAAKSTVPLLFAAGIASCFAFMSWKSWHVLLRKPTGFHRTNLVKQGRVRPAGFVWLAATGIIGAGLADNLAVNVSGFIAYRSDIKVQLSEATVFGGESFEVSPEMTAAAREGIAWYSRARSISRGGIALFTDRDVDVENRLVWLHAALGELPKSEAILRDAWERSPQEGLCVLLGRVIQAQGREDEANAWRAAAMDEHPEWTSLVDESVMWLVGQDRTAEAISAARALAARPSDSTQASDRLSVVLINHGSTDEVEEGIVIARETLARDPSRVAVRVSIALGQLRLRRPNDAVATLLPAVTDDTNEPRVFELLAEAQRVLGNVEQADRAAARAAELRSSGHDH